MLQGFRYVYSVWHAVCTGILRWRHKGPKVQCNYGLKLIKAKLWPSGTYSKQLNYITSWILLNQKLAIELSTTYQCDRSSLDRYRNKWLITKLFPKVLWTCALVYKHACETFSSTKEKYYTNSILCRKSDKFTLPFPCPRLIKTEGCNLTWFCRQKHFLALELCIIPGIHLPGNTIFQPNNLTFFCNLCYKENKFLPVAREL